MVRDRGAISHFCCRGDPAFLVARTARRPSPLETKVLIIEMVVPEVVAPTPVHLMDLNMLVMLDGRERTTQEFADLLGAAGLRFDRVVPTQGLFSLIEATKV